MKNTKRQSFINLPGIEWFCFHVNLLDFFFGRMHKLCAWKNDWRVSEVEVVIAIYSTFDGNFCTQITGKHEKVNIVSYIRAKRNKTTNKRTDEITSNYHFENMFKFIKYGHSNGKNVGCRNALSFHFVVLRAFYSFRPVAIRLQNWREQNKAKPKYFHSLYSAHLALLLNGPRESEMAG